MSEENRKLRSKHKKSQISEENGEHCSCCKDLLNTINTKLDQAIAAAAQINELNERLKAQEERCNNLEDSLNVAHTEIAELKTEVDNLHNLISTDLNPTINQLSNELSVEHSRGVKLESHSRRNNLRFYNIPQENGNETMEESEEKIRAFVDEELGEGDAARTIKIERAHRVGKPKPRDTRPRPLIVKFTFYKDKERIKSLATKLKGKKFGISDDFPKEVLKVRQNLLPILKKARQEGKKATLRFDNLYIEGKLYTGNEAFKSYALKHFGMDNEP